MSKMQRTKKSAIASGGFTLVELLVVISIISLLMSILMPALSGAREQAKSVYCLANLKNLTWGWMMYAYENDDNICSADTTWEVPPTSWVADGPDIATNDIGGTEEAIANGTFWSYTERTIELYKCKSDSSDLLRSYAISRTMNGKTCNCEKDNIKPFRTLTEIRGGTGKLVFVDAGSQRNWIAGSFCPVEQIDAVPPKWLHRKGRHITARHRGGCNMSFADGHCEHWKYSDRRTVELAEWQIGPDQASLENPDLERYVQMLWGKQ